MCVCERERVCVCVYPKLETRARTYVDRNIFAHSPRRALTHPHTHTQIYVLPENDPLLSEIAEMFAGVRACSCAGLGCPTYIARAVHRALFSNVLSLWPARVLSLCPFCVIALVSLDSAPYVPAFAIVCVFIRHLRLAWPVIAPPPPLARPSSSPPSPRPPLTLLVRSGCVSRRWRPIPKPARFAFLFTN